MTGEEKAEEEIFNEWKSEQYKDQSTEEKMEFVEHLHTFPWYFKKAFLAGLKAGKDMAEADLATIAYMQGAERYKTKWHKVADGDYPPLEKDGFSINIFTDRGGIAYYNHDFDYWIAEPASVEIDPPIAWCEIPKYKE